MSVTYEKKPFRWNRLHRRKILDETIEMLDGQEKALREQIQRVREIRKLVKRADRGQHDAVHALRALIHDRVAGHLLLYIVQEYGLEGIKP